MTANIAAHLPAAAHRIGHRPGVITAAGRGHDGRASYDVHSFTDLDRESARLASGLATHGVQAGTRVLMMVKPSLEFVALTFALLRMKALPVMIDPGMGLRGMLACVRQVEPTVVVGIPPAVALRHVLRGPFATVKTTITVGRRWGWGGPSLAEVRDAGTPDFEPQTADPDEPAAILFTSGSTGPAKGVLYAHGMFAGQIEMLQRLYGFEAGEIKVATFPLFALFCPALGMTCVLPQMNASKPAAANPDRIIEAICDHRATSVFGSPALWRPVADRCAERGLTLDSIRRVLIAGAPVPWLLVRDVRACLGDQADVHTPYGATEALPVASISGRELLDDCAERTRRGDGICVGRPVGLKVRIIEITDAPIALWDDVRVLESGQMGEIVVCGPVVTEQYWSLPDATVACKIYDGDTVWHRMGDAGYLDGTGRLWFCGRKAHRIRTADGTLFSVRSEAIFNEHAGVRRTALVGVGPAGSQQAVLVAEPCQPETHPRERLRRELLELGLNHAITAPVKRILFKRRLPVDRRHNAKINRETLAKWAEGQS
jgi:acyl-CoA synthetase (AMP-forming)/AMP-acid ligase II